MEKFYDHKLILLNPHPVFEEIVTSLYHRYQEQGYNISITDKYQGETGIHILFNAHKTQYDFDFTQPYIVFNYEQCGSHYLKDLTYQERMKKALAVFDYSYQNQKVISELLGRDVEVVPYKYHPILTSIVPEDETVDIFFCGWMNDHRRRYQEILATTPFKVEFYTGYNLWGKNLVKKLATVKIVLNLHFFTNPSILEVSRLMPALANKKLVLSEPSDDPAADERFKDLIIWITPENIVEECTKYLTHPELRQAQIEKAFALLPEI